MMSIDVHYVTNAVGKIISSVTMWNTVNQLVKHDLSCGTEVNNLKDRKLFLIKWIEIVLTQFLPGAIGVVPPVEPKMPWRCREWNNLMKLWSDKTFLSVFLSCHTRFRVNLHSLFPWISKSSFLETGAISYIKVTATGIDSTTTS